jgi:hypothetical protein
VAIYAAVYGGGYIDRAGCNPPAAGENFYDLCTRLACQRAGAARRRRRRGAAIRDRLRRHERNTGGVLVTVVTGAAALPLLMPGHGLNAGIRRRPSADWPPPRRRLPTPDDQGSCGRQVQVELVQAMRSGATRGPCRPRCERSRQPLATSARI